MSEAGGLGPLPAPLSGLFPPPEQRERVEDFLTRELAAALERTTRGAVTPDLDMVRFGEQLSAFDFETPQPLNTLLSWTIEQLEHGVVHMTHPRYFGLFNPAPNFPAQCADRIAGGFNPQLASSGSSPVPVAIEAHVARCVAHRAGLPNGASGHFTTSGSEANYTALVCALTQADPRFATDGVRAFAGPVAFYTSRECHAAWFKIAHQAGVGRSALRLIATDGEGRIDVRELSRAIAEDRARGLVPVMISATAGTTGAGMIDDLPSCASIARAEGLWYHVDAAWGGAALMSERLRGLLRGIEQADSITIDAHKWLAVTMGCGLFLTRSPRVLSEAFRVTADFMPSSVTSLDPYLNTVQWSRRFMGLRLFLSLAAVGWTGYAAHVEHSVALMAHIEQRLRERDWSVLNRSPLAVLCVAPPVAGTDIRELVRAVLATRRAWVAATSFEGRDAVRICATHGASTLADADALVDALSAAARGP